MRRVTGIGGIFMSAKDPKALRSTGRPTAGIAAPFGQSAALIDLATRMGGE